MLLIGDIHIHPRHSDGIIRMLRDFVMANDQEQTIVFVGDYVYHFSYHRPSLLTLLDFFLELVAQGKQVYVLAGNHDRLGQHFVYAEAEKIVQSSHSSLVTPWGSLSFVTTPQIIQIESEDILLLPYMLSWKSSEELNDYVKTTVQDRERTAESWHQLTIIHHYYVAETAFPWLRVKFGYKDLALSPQWLQDPRILLISWHIHHAFVYRNYLCIGAVRSTSPSETNQLNYLVRYDPQSRDVALYQVAYNPYLQISLHDESYLDEHLLATQRGQLFQQESSYFTDMSYYHSQLHPVALSYDHLNIIILSTDVQYDGLDRIVDPLVTQKLRSLILKRDHHAADVILDQLTQATQNFSSWRGDRKQLLDDYLVQKFGDRKGQYDQMLKKLGI